MSVISTYLKNQLIKVMPSLASTIMGKVGEGYVAKEEGKVLVNSTEYEGLKSKVTADVADLASFKETVSTTYQPIEGFTTFKTDVETNYAKKSDIANLTNAMVFKGTLGTGGTVETLPTTYEIGWTYLVTVAGTYAGQECGVGDLIIAVVAREGADNQDADWTVAQSNIDESVLDTVVTEGDLEELQPADIEEIVAAAFAEDAEP